MRQRFVVTLEGADDSTPVIIRLRALLKLMWRGYRLRCVEAREVGTEHTGDYSPAEAMVTNVSN